MSEESMANHIAETPSEISELLAQIQALQKENADLKDTLLRLTDSVRYDMSSSLAVNNAALFIMNNKATINRLLGGEK